MRLKISLLFIVAVMVSAIPAMAKERVYVEVRALETRLPYQEATDLPHSVTKHGISLAAHALNESESINLFAYDLNDDGYLPVKIVLTNTSPLRLLVHGSDVQLSTAGQTFSPVPAAEIIPTVQDHISIPFFNVSKEEFYNEDAIRKNAVFVNFNQKGLVYRILEPGQSVSGIAYFNRKDLPEDDLSVSLRVQDLGRIRYLTLMAKVH